MEINTSIVEHQFKFILQSPLIKVAESQAKRSTVQVKENLPRCRQRRYERIKYSKWASLIPSHLLHVE